MPRRKIVRTVDEEEEFQRRKREKRAESQAKRREVKRMMTKKDLKNIEADNHVSTNSSIKVVYPISGTITASQEISTSTITHVSTTKNNNEINMINDGIKMFNVNDNIEIIRNVHNSITETSLNNNIISSLPSTSNRLLININDNELENLVTSHEVSLQNNTTVNKNKRIKWNEKHRALKKGYTDINTSHNVTEHYIGEINISCEHCGAKHFNSEKVINKGNSFNDCCSHGSVKLDPLPQPPHELYELFIGNHPKSNQFYNRIRGYNNTFSFASFNANISNFNAQRRGPYCFKIQGQIYYQINTALYPALNEMPSYGQLFIIDSNEATQCRLQRNLNLDEEILRLIDNIIRTNNIFAQSYRMMHEEIQTQEITESQNIRELQLGFLTKRGIDRGRYNVQRVNEVAAIFSTTADGEIPETYVTIYNKNSKTLQQVSTMNPNVEPWIYPLYYPYGNQGWHENLRRKDNNNKRISRAAHM